MTDSAPDSAPPTKPADPPDTAAPDLQMCSVADWTGGDECLRVARWRIEPPNEHPVFMCNFHAEPFLTGAER